MTSGTSMNVQSTLQFNFNKQQISVTPREIPLMPESVYFVFSEATLNVPSTEQLQGRATGLQSACARLKDAQKSSIRDKILSILTTALVLAVLAAGVLLTLAGGHNLFPLAMMCYGAYLVASMAITNRMGPDVHGFVALVLAPFYPIYEAFTKVGSLKTKVDELQGETKKQLANTIAYFKDNYETLKDHIAAEKQKTEAQLKLEEKALDMRDPIRSLEKVQDHDELQAVIAASKAVEQRRRKISVTEWMDPASRINELDRAQKSLDLFSQYFSNLAVED
jgi:hypothetical protein